MIVDPFTEFTVVRESCQIESLLITFSSKDFEKYCKANIVKHILNVVKTPRVSALLWL